MSPAPTAVIDRVRATRLALPRERHVDRDSRGQRGSRLAGDAECHVDRVAGTALARCPPLLPADGHAGRYVAARRQVGTCRLRTGRRRARGGGRRSRACKPVPPQPGRSVDRVACRRVDRPVLHRDARDLLVRRLRTRRQHRRHRDLEARPRPRWQQRPRTDRLASAAWSLIVTGSVPAGSWRRSRSYAQAGQRQPLAEIALSGKRGRSGRERLAAPLHAGVGLHPPAAVTGGTTDARGTRAA